MNNLVGNDTPGSELKTDLTPDGVKRRHIPVHNLKALPHPGRDEILVVPIGGVGRIGMNWTLYGYDGQWVLVDAGVGFLEPDAAGPTNKVLIPDLEPLQRLGRKLVGMVVTHAHEDHIGAVARVWPRYLNCPIYAPTFAAEVLKGRFKETGATGYVDVLSFNGGEHFQVGPFAVNTIPVSHSVPDCVALEIRNKAGSILHMGDWKDDPEPVIGSRTDWKGLREAGQRGITAMVGDSTNADRDLPTTSEIQVRRGFNHVMKYARGMVVVACFGTNVARIASACVTARQNEREVALVGRSIRRSESIADSLGMLQDVPQAHLNTEPLVGLAKRNMALVVSGTQGEPDAALARMVEGRDRRLPQLEQGDVVVISARIIPGNEEAVQAIIDGVKATGATVLTGKDLGGSHPLHVSGHAGAREIKRLYETVQPAFGIPVHGEEHHLDAHAAIATATGARAVVPHEGAVLGVSFKHGVRSLGSISVAAQEMDRDNEEQAKRRQQQAEARLEVTLQREGAEDTEQPQASMSMSM